jgi:hypothetical protein
MKSYNRIFQIFSEVSSTEEDRVYYAIYNLYKKFMLMTSVSFRKYNLNEQRLHVSEMMSRYSNSCIIVAFKL